MRIDVLIITGQAGYHSWQLNYKALQDVYQHHELFSPTVLISPAKGEDMSGFLPEFDSFDVIALDYEGDDWPAQTRSRFKDFVKDGGGLVIVHGTNNSFPGWKAFNLMCGLGGWQDRNEKDGPYIYWKEEKIVRDLTPGEAGSHGEQVEFDVETRNSDHPIMKGMPASWRQIKDELYSDLRGPAENMDILATAYSDETTGGSGKHEPVMFTIQYHKGRVFHTVLGHMSEGSETAMYGMGFRTFLLRGTEWAATGKVTQAPVTEF